MTDWNDLRAALEGVELTGTCGFRLVPTDEMAVGPARATIAGAAGGWASSLAYDWQHPSDGPQQGLLVIASEDEDGAVAGWLVDSWHQRPGPMTLSGRRDGALTSLHATYLETWGWDVEVTLGTDQLRVVMRNVVPQEALAMAPEGVEVQAGPYDAMDLRVTRG